MVEVTKDQIMDAQFTIYYAEFQNDLERTLGFKMTNEQYDGVFDAFKVWLNKILAYLEGAKEPLQNDGQCDTLKR